MEASEIRERRGYTSLSTLPNLIESTAACNAACPPYASSCNKLRCCRVHFLCFDSREEAYPWHAGTRAARKTLGVGNESVGNFSKFYVASRRCSSWAGVRQFCTVTCSRVRSKNNVLLWVENELNSRRRNVSIYVYYSSIVPILPDRARGVGARERKIWPKLHMP